MNYYGSAQTVLSIGEWQSLFPFVGGQSVTVSPNNVYYSSEQGIVVFDLEDRDGSTITRVEGLSTTQRSKILYHEGSESVVAVYNTGVIDIIDAEGVFTMNDIANFDNIPINRNANFLYDLGDESVLLSADYGMSKIDVRNKKVLWTCFTFGSPVNAAVLYQGQYYAATDDGIYTVNENSIVENFEAWSLQDSSVGLPNGQSVDALTVFNGELYAGFDGTILKLSTSGTWEEIYETQGFEVRHLSGRGRHCLASFYCPNNCESKVIAFDANLDTIKNARGCASRIVESVEDRNGRIWYADEFDRFRNSPSPGEECSFLTIDGPFSNKVNDMVVDNGILLVTSGGAVDNFRYSFLNDGFFILNEMGQWSAHNLFNTQELKDRDLKGFHRVAVHPETKDQYYTTYWGGVVVYKADGTYEFYNEDNSTLRKKDANDQRERCLDLVFDRENNLWVTTYWAPENALSVLRNDGTWKGFNPPDMGEFPNQIAIDRNGFKWITITSSGSKGLYVFDEGEMDDDNDDRGYLFTRSNSELPTNNAICVEVDLEGDVWVGTDQGAVVFECGSDPFDGNCVGNRRKVEQDSILGLLLQTEVVRCIEVDGANRKWFGTNNGIYVQSPSGEEQVFELNTDNSPLPSNVINDIAIDPETGTAYIGTDKGIIAFRSDATYGDEYHQSEVIAYPNPVRPGYDGPIAIKGLPRDATIRITDISGLLVYQSEALGGQAIWDGRDYNGRRAESGIYLVFSTSQGSDFEEPEALVTKILLMN